MLKHKRGSIEWLEFEIFQEFSQIAHAIFLHTGEGVQEVMPCSSVVSVDQIHSAEVREVPLISQDEKCDGLITAQEDVGLLIKHADCQAAIVYDPVRNVIANVHAGWRGNVQNIYKEVARRLQSSFGSKPENLIVGISPSLGPCCAQFINFATELPAAFLEFQVRPLYFDLWEIARSQWKAAGVLSHHIQMAGICTCCSPDNYFSYRRTKGTSRHATVVVKKLTADVNGDYVTDKSLGVAARYGKPRACDDACLRAPVVFDGRSKRKEFAGGAGRFCAARAAT